ARFLNRAGMHLVKHRVDLEFVLSPGPFYTPALDRTGTPAGQFDAYANIDREHYWHGPETDDEGRATLRDLIPGATFCFFTTRNWDQRQFKSEPGKKVDLGDIVLDDK